MSLRHQFIEASRDLYLSEGLQGLSMRKVAQKCGVTAAAIYKHFSDKDQLIAAMTEEGFKLLEHELMKSLAGTTALERFRLTAKGYMSFALKQPGYYQLIFMSTARDFGFHQAFENSRNKLSPSFLFLIDRMREGRDAGFFPQLDPLQLAAYFWSLFHGLVSLQLMGHFSPVLKTQRDFENFYEHGVTFFMNNIKSISSKEK